MLPIFNISLIGRVHARRRTWSERAFRLIAETDARSVGDTAIAILLVSLYYDGSNQTIVYEQWRSQGGLGGPAPPIVRACNFFG